MAGQVKTLITGFVADVAVTRNTAVVQGADAHHATYAGAANATGFLGIVDEDKDAGLTASVVMSGTVYVSAAGAINIGDGVVIGDAQGRVATATGVATPNIIGHALEAATAAGDIILVKLV